MDAVVYGVDLFSEVSRWWLFTELNRCRLAVFFLSSRLFPYFFDFLLKDRAFIVAETVFGFCTFKPNGVSVSLYLYLLSYAAVMSILLATRNFRSSSGISVTLDIILSFASASLAVSVEDGRSLLDLLDRGLLILNTTGFFFLLARGFEGLAVGLANSSANWRVPFYGLTWAGS